MRCHYTNNNTPGIYEYGKHYLWLALSERDDNQVPSFRKNKDGFVAWLQHISNIWYLGKQKTMNCILKGRLLQRKRRPFRMPLKISVLSNGYGYRSR